MKTNITLSGRAELNRQEISQAIIEYLERKFNYKVEKVVYELPSQSDIKAIVEIKGVTTNVDEPIKSYHIDPPKTSNQPFGTRRPNWGIGLYLADMFEDPETILGLSEVFKKTQGNFPKLTLPVLKKYLKRDVMIGFKVKEANGYYQRESAAIKN